MGFTTLNIYVSIYLRRDELTDLTGGRREIMKYYAVLTKWNEDGCFLERHYIEGGSFAEAFCKTKEWFLKGWNVEGVKRV